MITNFSPLYTPVAFTVGINFSNFTQRLIQLQNHLFKISLIHFNWLEQVEVEVLKRYWGGCNHRTLSKKQNWPARPWPNQSFWNWNRLSPRVFAEKPSASCMRFRIWLILQDIFFIESEILITMGMVWPVSLCLISAPTKSVTFKLNNKHSVWN